VLFRLLTITLYALQSVDAAAPVPHPLVFVFDAQLVRVPDVAAL
jgi:hypothetical protein